MYFHSSSPPLCLASASTAAGAGETAVPEDIREFARSYGLTGYKVPKHVEFRDSLPETLVGKVLRRELLREEKEKATATG